MAKKSSGILMFRFNNEQLEVLLVHPGGPFFAGKDLGAWSIPKGEPEGNEDLRDTAIREFKEELGASLSGSMFELSPVVQKGGKTIFAWAVEGDFDPENIVCNTFTLEWPPKSGKIKEYPEVDKAEWFPAELARTKINPKQAVLIDELANSMLRP